MKKIFSIALVVCMAVVALGLTSCEKIADPAKYPVAGHVFVYMSDLNGGTDINLQFNMDFTAVMTQVAPSWNRVEYNWDMEGSYVKLMYPADVYAGEPLNTTLKKGTVAFEGTYDANERTLTLTSPLLPGGGTPMVMEMEK